MVKSKFYDDKRMEEMFAMWLDKHFYINFIGMNRSITRNSDIALQKKGVDVVIDIDDENKAYIDEKATLQYINKKLPTFAFEIINSTSGAQGWLYNKDYITTHYLLAWPNSKDIPILNSESFIDAEIMIIERKNVIKLLEDNGLTEEKILNLIQSYKNKLSQKNRFEIASGITLNFNMSLREKPINVVIKKNLLMKYASFKKIVR